jgi:hypothetical protein
MRLLHQATQPPDHAGQVSTATMEPPRMGEGRGIGARPFGVVGGHAQRTHGGNDWPGKFWGIRAPEDGETPLSYSEAIVLARAVDL